MMTNYATAILPESILDLDELPGDLREELLRRIANAELDLPMLPTIVLDVLTLTRSENVDAIRLSMLIHRDPSLAGHVLRIANSPLYRPASPIVSLQQAVARLGTTAIAEIAITASLAHSMFDAPGYEPVLRQIWRHSTIAAAFAREIARLRRQSVEAAFLCGLLHDIGQPAAISLVISLARKMRYVVSPAATLSITESVHQPIGLQLARAWKLPESVASAIGHHHEPEQATVHRDFATITSLADRLAHLAVEEPFLPESFRTCEQAAQLNLYLEDLDRLAQHRDRALAFAEVMG